MDGVFDLTPDEIYDAAVAWCGQKDRETFLDDIHYFQNNCRGFIGMRAFAIAHAAGRRALQAHGETERS